MIADIEATLLQMLSAELRAGTAETSTPPTVTFDVPSHPATASSRLNLYLYDMCENLERRESVSGTVRHPQDSGLAGRATPPVYVDFSFLVTAETGQGASRDSQLLFDVLHILFKHQAVPREYLQGSLATRDDPVLLTTSGGHPTPDERARLWNTLGEPLRPTITLVVTAKYYPFETKWSSVVREVLLGVVKGADPLGPKDSLHLRATRVSVAGMVISPAGDHPIAGATIRVVNTEMTTTTDRRGFFYLTNVPPGRRTVEVTATGYQTRLLEGMIPPPTSFAQVEPIVVELKADPAASGAMTSGQIEIDQRAVTTVSGHISYPDGRPAVAIPLRLGTRQTVTDTRGDYCFTDIIDTLIPLVAVLPGGQEILLPLDQHGRRTINLGE